MDNSLHAPSSIGAPRRPGLPLAVVVGAGGMAMAVARRLGAGHRLLIADRDDQHLERQQECLRTEGHDVETIVCDVTDPQAVQALADAARSAGGFKALAHVVGLSPSMADWRTIMAVNLVGPALVEKAFRPLLTSGVAAVFITSLAAYTKPPSAERMALMAAPLEPGMLDKVNALLGDAADTQRAYCDSKAALNRLCQVWAKDWGAHGARVNAIAPGLIASPMGAKEFAVRPEKYKLLNATPLTREGTMIEIADAVEFLLSEKASFISGIDLAVDGGVSAALGLRH